MESWQHPYSDPAYDSHFSHGLVEMGQVVVEEAVKIAVRSCMGFPGLAAGFHADSCSQWQKETCPLLH
jgi:hypothetical protein